MEVTACVFGFLAAAIAVSNWTVLYRWYRFKKRSTMILLFGGGFALLGTTIHPSIHWCWGFLAIAVDPGCFSFLGIPNAVEWGKRRFFR